MLERLLTMQHVEKNIFFVKNETSESIAGFWIKQFGTTNWGENQLTSELESGDSCTFVFINPLSNKKRYDLMFRTESSINAGLSYRKLSVFITNLTAIIFQNIDKDFLIGETGPAGGIIFYDKMSNSNGWRYLEAAPQNSEFVSEWGAFNYDVLDTQLAIGSGKSNTQLIVNFLNSIKEKKGAALRCNELIISGFSDWFLPSSDELFLMHSNIFNTGNFQNAWYWSSSQYFSMTAWNQNFNFAGAKFNAYKNELLFVRAARAF